MVLWYLWLLLPRRLLTTADQVANSPPLEPAFEHLLRNASVHESVIDTLRVKAITDRESFVNMFDAEAALKERSSDLGFNLSTGGLPHKREFTRVVSAWKTAKVMAETKLQTDAIARAHGVPVTLLPCDWISILTEFKKMLAHTSQTIDCPRSRCSRISPKSWPMTVTCGQPV